MATLGVITHVGLPVDTMDRASGFMHTRDTTLSARDASAIDCGQSDHPRNSQIAVYAQLSIQMRPIRDSTALEIRAAFRGRDRRKEGQSAAGSSIACTSSGWFENQLITMVQARSGAPISTRGQAPAPTLTSVQAPAPSPDRVRSDSLYPWIGSTSTRVYYRAGCDAANQVSPADRVFLSSREAAIAMGFSRSGTRDASLEPNAAGPACLWPKGIGMRTIWRVALAALLLLPATAPAQMIRGEGLYRRYGQVFGPWQPTAWSALDFRTRCDGEQVKGTDAGPIKWTIEYRNRSKELLSFDYVILPPGANKLASAAGTGVIKPGKSISKLAVVPTNRCDDGVLTAIKNVYLGAQADSVAAAKSQHQ